MQNQLEYIANKLAKLFQYINLIRLCAHIWMLMKVSVEYLVLDYLILLVCGMEIKQHNKKKRENEKIDRNRMKHMFLVFHKIMNSCSSP